MARGRERHEAKQAALAGLGRALARRSGGACELSGERGSLQVVEVVGGPDEPEDDWAVMVTPEVAAAIGGGKLNAEAMRYLETSIWSEVRPAQIAAIRLTRRLADQGVSWARDALDGLYIDEELDALL